ncbi:MULTISPECIES: FkbM family methyltransferase [unclassified Agrococcus]|uniref:FkbM family methyltransferase n=1 Tax=unclassified Agrococcus TaxID=2615065 RepID=UPI003623B21D
MAQIRGRDAEAGSIVNALGHRLWFDASDERGRALQSRAGDLNGGSLQLWRSLVALRRWDAVLDVGTNYGEMLLGVDLGDVGAVVGFEPNPRVLPHLLRSIDESGARHRIRDVAVSDVADEQLVFAIDLVWSGMSGLAATRADGGEHRVEEVAVRTTTIDAEVAALGEPASVLVKVDVEGAEHAVLAGATGLLASDRPWAVMVEVLHMAAHAQADLLARFDVAALDLAEGSLARVPAMSPQAWSALLATGWVYGQDVVLLAPGLADSLPSIVDVVERREQVLAPLGRDAAGAADAARTLEAAVAEGAAAGAERDAARADAATARAERDVALATVQALRASSSWRATRPLRAMVGALRRRRR